MTTIAPVASGPEWTITGDRVTHPAWQSLDGCRAMHAALRAQGLRTVDPVLSDYDGTTTVRTVVPCDADPKDTGPCEWSAVGKGGTLTIPRSASTAQADAALTVLRRDGWEPDLSGDHDDDDPLTTDDDGTRHVRLVPVVPTGTVHHVY